MTISSGPPAFLLEHLPSTSATPRRPHITLTWAQSLDSKIAGVGGKRVILSGPESMLMTQWMRTMHDAILIGVNTLILDDSRLQINLLPSSDSYAAPQPIVLDPKLRFPLNARILSEWTTKRGDNSLSAKSRVVKQPWIVCGEDVDDKRVWEVERAGARVIRVELDEKGYIPPESLPSILTSLNLRSVMIEGGSRVLSTFLHSPNRPDGSPLVDSIIVTVAPTFIGEGIGVVPQGEDVGLPSLRTIHTETMGKDAVMVCTIESTT